MCKLRYRKRKLAPDTNTLQWLQYLHVVRYNMFVLQLHSHIITHIYYTFVVAFKSVFYFYLFLIATPPCARKKMGESPRARGVSRLIDLRVIYIYIVYRYGIYYNIIVLSGGDMLI